MHALLSQRLADSVATVSGIADDLPLLTAIARHLFTCLRDGGMLYFCGNGGSAADAQHVAAELVGRFLIERRPLAAVALPYNSSIITAIGNGYSFDEVFSRQVRALTRRGDSVIGISTSGTSRTYSAGSKREGLLTLPRLDSPAFRVTPWPRSRTSPYDPARLPRLGFKKRTSWPGISCARRWTCLQLR